MLTGMHISALTRPGQALGSRSSTDRPGPARGRAVGGLWPRCGRGCGQDGAGTRQMLSNQPTDRVPGAGTEQGEPPEGPAQLEGALTLGLPVWKAGSMC